MWGPTACVASTRCSSSASVSATARPRLATPPVVHQDVHEPEVSDDRVDHRHIGRLVVDAGPVRTGLAAGRLDRRHRGRGRLDVAPVVHRNGRSGRRQTLGDGPADAAPTTGDQGHATIQLAHGLPHSTLTRRPQVAACGVPVAT